MILEMLVRVMGMLTTSFRPSRAHVYPVLSAYFAQCCVEDSFSKKEERTIGNRDGKVTPIDFSSFFILTTDIW